jgi:hypothetical protein
MNSSPLNSKLHRGKTEVLVIHCGDYRFQGAFGESLNRVLNLSGGYDLMVVPGGPLSLALLQRHSDDSRATWKWFRFFVEHHGIRRVVLIQHQDCAWYQEVPPGVHGSRDLRERQEQDLARISGLLKEGFPGLLVESFYAGWDTDDRVTIETVAP